MAIPTILIANGAVIEGGVLRANSEYPGLIIRYTTDGSDPSDRSMVFDAPVAVTGTVRIRSFDSSGRSSRIVDVSSE